MYSHFQEFDLFLFQHRPMFKELWKFNLMSRKWTKIQLKGDAPTMLASHTAQFMQISRRPKMVVYGGTALPFGQNLSIKVHICDLITHKWESIETNDDELPMPLYGQASAAVDDDLYIIGGTSGHRYFMDVHHFNLTQKKWTLLGAGTESVEFIQNLPDRPSSR